MLFNSHDIIVRRERNGRKVLWINQSYIIVNFDVSESYLRQKCRVRYRGTIPAHRRKQDILPDSGASWRYATINGQFYYDYDRLPEKRQQLLGSKASITEEYDKAMAESSYSKLEMYLRGFVDAEYEAYLFRYAECGKEKAEKLAKAAATIIGASEYIDENQIPPKKMPFYIDLGHAIKAIGISYLPCNYRRVKQKVDCYRQGDEIETVVKLPRSGMRNALKFSDAELIGWLMYLRSCQENYPSSYIARKVAEMCKLTDKKVPSQSWLRSKLSEQRTKFFTMQRFGSGRKGDRYAGYMPVENALFTGDCWQMDGTRVNFIAHKDDGRDRFLYIVVVYDVHSGDVLGYHFDHKEDRWAYVHALKMATNLTGYLPWELVIDRFPGHNTQEWRKLEDRLKFHGVNIAVTSNKKGKAKVERFFRTLQEVFMQDSKYYYGEGVQSRNDYAHRSPEYLRRMQKEAKREGWDFGRAYQEAITVIEAYRNTKLSSYSRKFARVEFSPRELRQKSDKPNIVPVRIWERLELFGLEKKVTIRNAGLIKTEIQRVVYHYTVEAYETIRDHKSVRLCYDMEDLSIVHLWEDSDDVSRKYLGEAKEQRAAKVYGPDREMSDVGLAKARIKRIEEQRKVELQEMISDPDEVSILLAGLSSKPTTASAESQWLVERTGDWKDTGKARIMNMEEKDEDDGEGLLPDAREQY